MTSPQQCSSADDSKSFFVMQPPLELPRKSERVVKKDGKGKDGGKGNGKGEHKSKSKGAGKNNAKEKSSEVRLAQVRSPLVSVCSDTEIRGSHVTVGMCVNRAKLRVVN